MGNIDKDKFTSEVYDIVRAIPAGCVLTYGLLARLAGHPLHSRLVGRIMSMLPKDRNLPCHRVVNSQGRLVSHWAEQRELLEKEGVRFKTNGCVDMNVSLWEEASLK